MNIRKILSFKHWQLFLLMVVCGSVVGFGVIIEAIFTGVAFATSYIWIYAIVIYGQEKMERLGIRTTNLRLFKMSMIAVVVILMAAIMFPDSSENDFSIVSFLCALSGFFVVFLVLRIIFIMCKTIVSLKLQREATFGEYYATILLYSILPIGIWFIQPRVNKLIGNKSPDFNDPLIVQ